MIRKDSGKKLVLTVNKGKPELEVSSIAGKRSVGAPSLTDKMDLLASSKFFVGGDP